MRYPDLWFEDGDIILSAENAHAELRMFCVHKRTLSIHSPVFLRIFKLPAMLPPNDDFIEEIDGVKVMKVKEPSIDWATLLRCLYHPQNMPFKKEEPTVNVDMAGLLRVCKKYAFNELYATAVHQLMYEWPTSLAIFDEHETRIRTLGIAHHAAGGRIDGQYLDDALPEPVAIIKLAQEFNIPSLLPAAFYALSCVRPTANYDTFHSPLARLLPDAAQQLTNLKRSARWPLLTSADLLRLARGQDRMRSPSALFALFDKYYPEAVAARKPDCTARYNKYLRAVRDTTAETHDILGALTYLRIYVTDPASPVKACACCTKCVLVMITMLRLTFWLSLPELFGFPEVKTTK
ncbi:hypothetical protein C8R43DRAFT_128786 [Mycena crocata]|nr:hypothetical protein C8R43DRAFT_128786 [Mycena crocata]